MAYVDAAFMHKVLDIPKGQRKSDVHEYAKLDDLRRGLEVAERVLGLFQR